MSAAPKPTATRVVVNLGPGRLLLPAAVILVLLAAAALWLSGMRETAHDVAYVALLITSVPLLLQTARQALHANFATDAVATLAIITAIILDHPIPGLVIVLMQSGGEALEEMAQRRA